MKSLKKQVKKFCRQNGIKKSVTLVHLIGFIRDSGYGYLSYTEGQDIIVKNNWIQDTETRPAFTAVTEDEKYYVFYDEKQPKHELLFFIAHECGHIFLGHMFGAKNALDTINSREIEANKFATVLLYLGEQSAAIYNHAISWIAGCAAVCFAFYLIFSKTTIFIHTNQTPVINRLQIKQSENQTELQKETNTYTAPASGDSTNNKSDTVNNKNSVVSNPTSISNNVVQQPTATDPTPQQSPTVTQEPFVLVVTAPKQEVNQSETVVVTETGKKYHKPTCGHVKGRPTRNLTINEAVQQGYSACLDCFR